MSTKTAIRTSGTALRRTAGRGALPLVVAGMDACWIYTVTWLFSAVILSQIAPFYVPHPVVLALLELGGWGLTVFLLDRTRIALGIARLVVALVGLAVSAGVAFAYNPAPATGGEAQLVWVLAVSYALIISVGLWALGSYRGSERITFEEIYSIFRFGMAAIATAALLSTVLAFGRVNNFWSELSGVALWFFGLALCGLALGNRDLVRRERSEAAGGSWGLLLAISVGAILLLGTIGQALGGRNVFDALQEMVRGTLVAIGTAIYAVVYVILWPLSLIHIEIGPWNQEEQPPPVRPPDVTQKQWEELLKKTEESRGFNIPPEWQMFFMWLAAALVVGVILFALTRLIRRTRRNAEHNEEEEREGFGSWSLVVAQVRALLDRILSRFRKPTVAAGKMGADEWAALRANPDLRGTLSVREIYARLLTLAGKAGYPRPPQTTPLEYLSTLQRAMPSLQGEWQDITAAYIEARYGPLPASTPVVQQATIAWRRAERELQERIQARAN